MSKNYLQPQGKQSLSQNFTLNIPTQFDLTNLDMMLTNGKSALEKRQRLEGLARE